MLETLQKLWRVVAGQQTTEKTLCLYFLSSLIMALEEDRPRGTWKEKRVCMGDKNTCSFPGFINHHHKFIISFAEDETGFFFSFSFSGLFILNLLLWLTNLFFSKVSSTSWPLPTLVVLPLLGPFSNLWTPLGEHYNSEEEEGKHRNRVKMLFVVLYSLIPPML